MEPCLQAHLAGFHAYILRLAFQKHREDPPIMALSTGTNRKRFAHLLVDAHKMLTTLHITNTIKHIEKIINAQVSSLDTIEWIDEAFTF